MKPQLTIAIALALGAFVFGSPAEARRDRTVAGDVIKAARFLTSSRIDEAKSLLTDLKKRAPDAIEVKWLEAELAFQTGDYAAAVKLLDKVPDTAVDGTWERADPQPTIRQAGTVPSGSKRISTFSEGDPPVPLM